MKLTGSLFALSTMLFMSCAQENTNLTGSWLEPVPGMPDMEQGIKLESSGKASSINMETLQYESWKQEGDLLILTGKSIGNHQTIPFSDTARVEKLTADTLIIKQQELRRSFSKSKSQ